MTLPHFVSLGRLRAEPALRDMLLFKWTRLSVQPVTEAQFEHIVAMAQVAAPEPAPKLPRGVVKRPKRRPKRSVKTKRSR
jgi:hypothetical protein